MNWVGENCTILVSSCDKYEDAWLPFFKILKEQWPDRPYPIVLNTESKSFSYEGMEIKTFNLYNFGKNIPWGKRLIDTLKKIDTKYILFLLEDFYPLEKVKQERISECINWMEEDSNIAVFSFYRTKGNNIRDNKYPHFEKRPQIGEYRLNCQPAIWRKDRLLNFIKPHESPWDWEIWGSIRSKRYKDSFYSAIDGEPYIFTHSIVKYGLRRGRWLKETKNLFGKYEIEVDFSRRGFYENPEKTTEELTRISKATPFSKKVLRRIKHKIWKGKENVRHWRSLYT